MSFVASSSNSLLIPAPGVVYRGWGILPTLGDSYAQMGSRLLVIGGSHSLALLQPRVAALWHELGLKVDWLPYGVDCAEVELQRLRAWVQEYGITGIVGVGGGKALDTAKLVGHQMQCPVITIPTSAATCAAWTALANVYRPTGSFAYDVALAQAPVALIMDYELIQQAPERTLRAGIGDALAKWYEASVSSSQSEDALIIAAVQQARVLRDLLLQRSGEALRDPGGIAWVQVVDACVCLAGVIGGLGGARCRTVAAHAVHNGLTHVSGSRRSLHGEKVAYGILVQLRLEEMVMGHHLAFAARRQLVSFYQEIGLPTQLSDLYGTALTSQDLSEAAQQACLPQSDIHHLPFPVTPALVMTAMQTTLNEQIEQAVAHSHSTD